MRDPASKEEDSVSSLKGKPEVVLWPDLDMYAHIQVNSLKKIFKVIYLFIYLSIYL